MTTLDTARSGAASGSPAEAGVGRGLLGTMIAPPRFDDESYLDFVEGLRSFVLSRVNPVAAASLRAAVAARAGTAAEPAGAAAGPEAPATVPAAALDALEVDRLAADLPVVALRNRLLRSSQEMIWQGVTEAYGRRADELRAMLDAPRPGWSGSLSLDPDLELPDYLTDYHLQPGGYHSLDLAGFVYHYGTKVFWVGANDQDQAKTAMVAALPTPADGRVRRVLDLGCSVGQSTTALWERFPHAEVWGIDVAAPLLRYAALRAARLGAGAHFAQGLAEDLDGTGGIGARFADGSVDLVYASILFHEVPLEVGRRIVAGVHRVLRPGGLFVVSDLTLLTGESDVWADYDRRWDSTFNSEPHEYPFLRSDFTGLLREYFDPVEVRPSTMTTTWTATRAGQSSCAAGTPAAEEAHS